MCSDILLVIVSGIMGYFIPLMFHTKRKDYVRKDKDSGTVYQTNTQLMEPTWTSTNDPKVTDQAINSSQNDLKTLNEDLNQLYQIICACNGDSAHSNLLSASTEKDDQLRCPRSLIQKNVDNLQNLAKYLKTAFEKHLELIQEKNEMREDQEEQIDILKVLLLKKCQQIATLRQISKTEKQTADYELTDIKSIYEHEKQISDERMAALRAELSLMRIEIMQYSITERIVTDKLETIRAKNVDLRRYLVASEKQNQSLRLKMSGVKNKIGKTKFQNDDENNKTI